MGKGLLRDAIGDSYQVDDGYLHARSSTVIELLRKFKAGVTSLIWRPSKDLAKGKTNDYSRMTYDALRKIADNDAVADNMSEGEYESLSVELWRKFSAEKRLTRVPAQIG